MKTTSATGNSRNPVNRHVGARFCARGQPVAPGRALLQQQCGGFTLIELSIAVFIIAIIMAVSVPNFIRSYNSSLLNSMGRALVTTCEFARLNAVLHQQKIALHVDLDKPMIWLTQAGAANATDRLESRDQSLKTIEIPPRVGLASVQIGDQPPQQKGQVEALFYPNGTCDGFTVTFRGTEKGSGLAVVVDPVTSRGVPWPVKP